MTIRSLVWLRDDLRLADNPALNAALAQGGRVAALYVHEDDQTLRPLGAAARWWLGKSLASLERSLDGVGIPMLVEAGDPKEVVLAAARRLGAACVFWNRRYAPAEREIDAAIKAELRAGGRAVTSYPGNVLVEPWEIQTGGGGPYQVYTPFAKAVRQRPISFPLPHPLADQAARSLPADGAGERPGQPRWALKLESHWTVGETAARQALERFLDEALGSYVHGRDRPGLPATSALSPHLRFGEISARQIWHAASAASADDAAKAAGVEKFLSEITWRDFNYHQLFHRDDIASIAMRDTLAGVEWRNDAEALLAWKQGRTGFPIVDAGMRQLWETGWMHNRVRMLVASLLVKNLLIDWQLGEQWFWDTLVDADAASNPGNWQWVAGCGMDAAPYFRVFNPVIQGERFDPDGAYVRRWVPELSGMPNAWIHRPFEAPGGVLESAGVILGETYPRPIVDLKASQKSARERFASLKA
ncbi:deoxyribodipyrimidine photo-lyase [Mesorhizobium sp. KR1-2]|uniref:cryptochrome/photolyase family protein n=1 Tax=Mesorhizobium sp. KR1-2 TaxID=3156609 RepID=UPI0032B5ABD0